MLEEIVMSFARVSCCHCQWTQPALGKGGEEARQAPAAPAPARGGPAPCRTACLSAFFHALAPTREPGSRGRGKRHPAGARGRGGKTAPRVQAGRRAPEGRAATGCTPRALSLPKPGRALPAGDAAHRGPGAEGRRRGGWGLEEQKTRLLAAVRHGSRCGGRGCGRGRAALGSRLWGPAGARFMHEGPSVSRPQGHPGERWAGRPREPELRGCSPALATSVVRAAVQQRGR